MTHRSIIAALLTLLTIRATTLCAETKKCPSNWNREIALSSARASASYFANMRGAEDSVNATTDRLLAQARLHARNLMKKGLSCRAPCTAPVVAVIFDSVPNERLVEYAEREQCEQLLGESEINPLRYDNREFKTPEDAKKWYRDLTQGNGRDGKDLYERCPGRCSPSYSSTVYFKGEELSVSTSAICGHARDKDDDQYRLKTALKWVCP